MTKIKKIFLTWTIIGVFFLCGCEQEQTQSPEAKKADFPKIASWLAKKEEIISSKKPYSLVMSGWFTQEEADEIKTTNPEAKLLAGLSVNWTWDNKDWMSFLTTVANYDKKKPIEITEDMYLHKPNGERCAFGWASDKWGHEEIYAMDLRNKKWTELIVSFYDNVLKQPQHDGIIVDMITEKQWWCPESISNDEWLDTTKNIFAKIKQLNTNNKLVVFNAGKDIYDIDEFKEYFDGYLMENLLGNQLKANFDDGLKASDDSHFIIYAVDTDDTGQKDLKKMRLGLTLSLLNDNTYFTYDFGPRDHGQAWWFPEYDADLGDPKGKYYQKNNAYFREFEKGIVVSAPYANVIVNFEEEMEDITTGLKHHSFTVDKGDGRIYIKK